MELSYAHKLWLDWLEESEKKDGEKDHSQNVYLVRGVPGHDDEHDVSDPELDAAGTEHCFHDGLFPMLAWLRVQMGTYGLE